MLLKRNLFTIIYSAIFFGIMGTAFAAIFCLSLSEKAERNIVACIIVLGLIVYLLAGFLIKEKGILLAAEENHPLSVILEAVLVLGTLAGILFLYYRQETGNIILTMLILICTYAVTRVLGGRICGIFGLVLSFFFLANVSFQTIVWEECLNSLCFLVPYFFFLLVTVKVTDMFSNNGFIIVSSYLVLAIVFSFAMIINPFVCILLLGCVFSLFFGKAERASGILSSGPVAAGILFLAVFLIVAAFGFLLPEMIILPNFKPDDTLFASASAKDAVAYVFEKYKESANNLYLPFSYKIFPAVLAFMGTTAGYYAIRKKYSGIGPLCFSYVALTIIFILYDSIGKQFYYMTYFLPVFAAYGFANTLLPEIQRKKEEQETKTEQESEWESEPESEWKAQPEIQLEIQPEAQPEETVPVETQPIEEEDVNMEIRLEDIPEWKVSDSFFQKQEQTTQNEMKEEVKEDIIEEVREEVKENIIEKVREEEPLDSLLYNADDQNDEDSQEDESKLNDLLNRLDISDSIRRMNESAQEDIADVIEREEEQIELSAAIPTEKLIEPEDDADTLNIDTLTKFSPEPTSELSEPSEMSEDPAHIELPKYEKPDFQLEPVSQPLTESFSEISEYDEVPTIHDLESKWKTTNEQDIEPDLEQDLEPAYEEVDVPESMEETSESGFAYSLEDVLGTDSYSSRPEPEPEPELAPEIEPELELEPEIIEDIQEETSESVSSLISEEPELTVMPEEEPETHPVHKAIHSEEIVKKTSFGKRSYHKITLG